MVIIMGGSLNTSVEGVDDIEWMNSAIQSVVKAPNVLTGSDNFSSEYINAYRNNSLNIFQKEFFTSSGEKAG